MRVSELIKLLQERDPRSKVALMIDVHYPGGGYALSTETMKVYESFSRGPETTILGTIDLKVGTNKL